MPYAASSQFTASQAAQAAAASAVNAATAASLASSAASSMPVSNSTVSLSNNESRADSATPLPNNTKIFKTSLRRPVPPTLNPWPMSSNPGYYSNHNKRGSISEVHKSSSQDVNDTDSIYSVSINSINPNKWNELNNNSSNIAMAAASSIAHQKPNQFVSHKSSPKIIRSRKLPPSSSQVSPRLRQSSQLSAQDVIAINEQTNIPDHSDLQSLRKPPPVSLSSSQDGVSIYEYSSNSNISLVDNNNNNSSNNNSNNFYNSNVYSNNRHSTSTSILNTQSPNYSTISADSINRSITAPINASSFYNNQSIDDLPSNYTSSQQLKFKTTLRNNNRGSSTSNSKNKSNFSKINSKSKSIKNKISNGNSGNGNSNLEFDEDKPWKNHQVQFLNIITSDERKRYEGVFAANKSIYLPETVSDINNTDAAYNSNIDRKNRDKDYDDNANTNTDKEYDNVNATDNGNNSSENVNVNIKCKDKNNYDAKTLDSFINSYSIKSRRISGLVVHDIWIRSKLDGQTLSKIWNLLLDDRKRRWFKLFLILHNENNNPNNTNIVTREDDNVWVKNGLNEILKFMESNEHVDNGADNKNNDGDGHFDCSEEAEHISGLNATLLNPPILSSSESMKSLTSLTSAKLSKSPLFSKEVNNQKETKSLLSLSPQKLKSILDSHRPFFDDGTLTCEEFIVGMWLIDQCLYGRKLPKVIPLSVWETIGVNWISPGSAYGTHRNLNETNYNSNHHHNVPIVTEIVGIGIKTSKGTKRGVFKKVMGKK